MKRKEQRTKYGTIVYWTNEFQEERKNLVFLPGLTADHRLFEKQIEQFKNTYNIFVWDAPGHAASRPFTLDFELKDKAIWLHEILLKEKMKAPILIGQSMGGYVSQMYLELYKDASGFVSIDSAPLQREYVTGLEIYLLKHIEPIYRFYPWKLLLTSGSKGVATTKYGQGLMKTMMEEYSKDTRYYSSLAGHGYRMLAQAMENDLPYKIYCPAILICGQKDQAGSAKNYNKRWEKKTGLPMYWIENAGHNSNTDKPEQINTILENFIQSI